MNQIDSEYAPFGTRVSGPPTRPEKPAEEIAADLRARRITKSALLKKLGWDESDLERASAFGFPSSSGRTGTLTFNYGSPVASSEPYWFTDQIETWRQALLALAKQVK
jgi:hypothetical protein